MAIHTISFDKEKFRWLFMSAEYYYTEPSSDKVSGISQSCQSNHLLTDAVISLTNSTK